MRYPRQPDSNPPVNWHDFVPKLVRDHAAKTVVEVGVWKGHLAEALMTYCPDIERLWLVDNWELSCGQLPDGRWISLCAGGTQDIYDDAYRITQYKMGPFQERVRIVRAPSVQAATRIDDESIDVAIIDALHFMPYVEQDILAWLPKLKTHGLMIGDDYGLYFPGVEYGVRRVFGERYQVWGLSERATWWAYKEDACLVNA